MTTIALKIGELPRAMRGLEGKIRKALRAGVRGAARRGQAHMMHNSPVDMGELKASWRLQNTTDDGPGGQTLRNDAPHAGIVEEGARPHPVSFEGRVALEGWVRRHFPNLNPGEQQSMAQGIANKIAAHGQKPTYFVRNELPHLTGIAAKELERALRLVKPTKDGK